MFALLFLAPIPGLAPQFQVPAPGTRNCSDGSVVAATDFCPLGIPNHRYLLDHEPQRREIIERWWCGLAEEPNEAKILVELRQPGSGIKKPYYVSRLVTLAIDGKAPSARLLKIARAKIAGLGQVVDLSTRCLDTPSQGVIGILNVNYWEGYEQRVQIELRP